MAETFRKRKIEKIFTQLRIERHLKQIQMENNGLLFDIPQSDYLKWYKQGYIEALDKVLKQLETEFDLYNPDNPESDISKLAVE